VHNQKSFALSEDISLALAFEVKSLALALVLASQVKSSVLALQVLALTHSKSISKYLDILIVSLLYG